MFWRGRLSPVVLALAVAAAPGAAAVRPAPITPGALDSSNVGRVSALRNLPGYRPLVDPESTAVLLGRRTNAPLVAKPFTGGARSLDDLGRTVCRLLHRREADSLNALCVTEDEFRDILWREFPQSRPATGLKWEDAWTILYARLRAGILHALRDHGDDPVEFLRFERFARGDSIATYRNFRMHNALVMVVRTGSGEIEKWRWLRSVAERRGRFKISSTDD